MLIERIECDQMVARKAHAPEGLFLTTLVSEIKMVGKNARNGAPTEDETITVVKKFIKGAVETFSTLVSNDGAEAKLAELEFEIATYEKYLPVQLTLEELKRVVKSVVDILTNEKGSKLEMRDMSIVISRLSELYKNQYDGKSASTLIRELIMHK